MANAIKLRDLEVIEADITSAEAILKASEAEANKDNKNLLCMAGYHLGQAAEKCLKGIIKADRRDLYDDVSKTHDIAVLLQTADTARNGVNASHPYIAENAKMLGSFNDMRYGLKSITRREVNDLLKAVKEFHAELKADHEKAYPDPKKNAEYLRNEWNSRPKADLHQPPKPETAERKSAIELQIEAEKAKQRDSYGRAGQQKKQNHQNRNKNHGHKQNSHGKHGKYKPKERDD